MEIGTLGWSGPNIALPFRGGTGVNGANAPLGTLLIGNGSGYTLAAITGTNNQIVVTNGNGSITLSTPQDINTSASPTFNVLNLTAASNQLILAANGTLSWAPTAARTITLPDVTGTVITTGNLSSITATGTIASGIWHASTIGNLYGGTGLDTSTAANGTLLIGTGTGFALATLAGTSNQVVVTNASGTITLSLPQSINTGATPVFDSLALGASSNQILLDSLGLLSWTPTGARTISFPDVSGTVITTGNLTSITTVGTITTGTWNGTTISNLRGGTGLDTSTAANGALLIGNGTGFSLATLSAGTGVTINNSAGSITISAGVQQASAANVYNWANFS